MIDESGPMVVTMPKMPNDAMAYDLTPIMPEYNPAKKSPIVKAIIAVGFFIAIPKIAGSDVPATAEVIAAASVSDFLSLKYIASVTKPRTLLYITFEKNRIGSHPVEANRSMALKFPPPKPKIVM